MGVEFINLECGKFDRKNLDKTILGIPKTIKAFFSSLSIISQYQPQIIVSFGGYVSVPVIVASWFKKIPSITHEQTTTTSMATKINSFFATKVALSFNNHHQINQLPASKTTVTGNLLRREIFSQSSKLKDKVSKPFIYFTGGNQGSIFLNELIYKIVPKLSSKFFILHQTGKNNNPKIQDTLSKKYNYLSLEFIETEDIGWVLNQSELVISRSGANICQELDALDKKSILIPHPFTQQNEQQKNAIWLKKLHPKTTTIISQSRATPSRIVRNIISLAKVSHKPNPTTVVGDHPLFQLIHEITL